MMDAQQPGHVSLGTLLGRIKEGRYVVPDFQREFEWDARDIRDLIASIFRDYYIGSLLLWRGLPENFSKLSCEPLFGRAASGNREFIVLDGQQRLTALHYALVGPDVAMPRRAKRAHFFVRVDRCLSADDDEAFDYRWAGTPWTAIAGTEALQFERHVFPLDLLGRDGIAWYKWTEAYKAFWQSRAQTDEAAQAHVEAADAFQTLIQGLIQNYQVSYVELDRQLPIGKICDIFTQINTRGVRLTIFDLMNALLKPSDIELKKLWRDARPTLARAGSDRANIYVLQVMSIRLQDYCSPKYLHFLLPGERKPQRGDARHDAILVPDATAFEAHWHAAVEALATALQQLYHPHEFGVTAARYLPYQTILPVFAALLARIQQQPALARGAARRKFNQWYWASVFTNQYSASSESTSARDFQEVSRWFDDDDHVPLAVRRFGDEVSTLSLSGEVRQGTSIYNGVFNLMMLNGARDWVETTVPDADLQDHHIIPAAWGRAQALGDRINTILNRCPLTPTTNRDVISDRLPNAYLPELIESRGRNVVEALLGRHFISPTAIEILLRTPFAVADFEAFIDERQRTIRAAIRARLIDDPIAIPADLRALDARIDAVERRLRSRLAALLDHDAVKLPSHVAQKIGGRLAGEARNPAFVASDHAALEAQLAYADLRELQDIGASAALRSVMLPVFGPVEAQAVRYAQLAGLRNAIRHSRHADAIVRTDGEAGILWFEKILN